MTNSIEQFYEEYANSIEFYEESLKTQIILAFQDWFMESGRTQKEVAEELGIKPASLSRLLAGKTNMTMNSAAKLLKTADFLPLLENANKRNWHYANNIEGSATIYNRIRTLGHEFYRQEPAASCSSYGEQEYSLVG